MLALPTVTTCEGCGACCRHIGTPPGFFAAYASSGWDGLFLIEEPDFAVWQAMPELLRADLTAFYASQERLPAGELPRSESGLPCIWFDEGTGHCRNYEHRPTACRDFDMGGEDCLELRKEAAHA